MFRRVLIFTVLSLIVATSAVAQQDFSSLEEMMSGEEFRRAGLDKLTPEELAALNAWLSRKPPPAAAISSRATSAPAPVAQPAEDRRGFENRREDIDAIEAQLVGEFTGWSGKTRFKLDNGQVWQQTRGGGYRASTKVNPRVTIEPKLMGSWALRVEGVNRTVRVKRIK